MQTYGFKYENVRKECAAIVLMTDIKIQNTFRPVLSIMKPNNGLAPADIKYTSEQTKLASSAWRSYFCMKNILKCEKRKEKKTERNYSIRLFGSICWIQCVHCSLTHFPRAINGKMAT